VCKAYNEAFKEINTLKIPQTNFDNVSPFIYTVRVLNGKRGLLINHLRDLLIDTGIHWLPIHKHTFFAKEKRSDMTVTDKVVDEILTLPLHSNMKSDFVDRVIKGVSSFFKHA